MATTCTLNTVPPEDLLDIKIYNTNLRNYVYISDDAMTTSTTTPASSPLVLGQAFDLPHDLEDGLLLKPPRHDLNGQRHSDRALRRLFHPFHELRRRICLC